MFVGGGSWSSGSPTWTFISTPLMSWAWQESQTKVKESSTCLLVVAACSWILITVLWHSTPGIFVSIAHLSVTGAIALPFWTAMVLASALTCTNDLLASLVPSGTPVYLLSVLVIVEFFSHLMRPLALCARLSLTMMTGHIMLGLAWALASEEIFAQTSSAEVYQLLQMDWNTFVDWYVNNTPELNFMWVIFVFWISTAFSLVELGVGFLQSYIFFTLVLFFNTQYPRT
nr:ATP synthase F0 subunit 6 [Nipponacmea sp. JM-2022]